MKSVAVIGSGASGLAAALAAAQGGARVSIYEAHDKLGGTTALSGGNAWLPAHAGLEDDTPELALTYLRSLALGDADDEMLGVFAHQAGPAAERLQRDTPVRLQPVPYCDYHAEFEGGREQGGRTLEPQPYDPSDEVRELLRDAPNVLGPVTYVELSTGTLDRELLAERRAKGTITLGRALLAGLLQECLDLGVDLYPGTRLHELPDADAVVLATGGFERDAELAKHFLRGPMLGPVGAPTARGDGLRMAIAAGAQLGNMSEAWWCPSISIPGETIDGAPMFRLILAERARPGTLIVDGSGRRFVNEAQNYNDLGRSLQNFNPAQFRFPHVPAWMIFDNAVRTGYRLGPLGRRDPDPDWLARGETVAELAREIDAGPRGPGGDGRALQRRRERRRGPRLWARQLPLRPFHRHAGGARRRSLLRGCASSPAACRPRAAPRPTPTVACSRSPTGRRSRACTPPATSPRAASGWPIPAPVARSGRA